jgi:hypothetical protein
MKAGLKLLGAARSSPFLKIKVVYKPAVKKKRMSSNGTKVSQHGTENPLFI